MSTVDQSKSSFHGRVARGVAAILELADDWDDLGHRATTAPPFVLRSWLQPWLQAGRMLGAPAAVTAWQGPQLAGLLVIAVRSIGGLRIGEPVGTGFPCYLGVLADPAHPDAVRQLAATFMSERVADAFHADDLSGLDLTTTSFLTELEQRGFRTRRSLRNPCLYITLGGSHEQYLATTKSSKSRGNLRRLETRLMTSGDVKSQHLAGREITAGVMQRVAAIQNESWMKERGAAVLADPFFQKTTLSAALAGIAHVWLLTVDGQDAAFVYALVHHDQLHYVWTAFRLSFEAFSVGRILTNWSIRDACEMGMRTYDFGHGEAEYKRFWSTDSHDVSRVIAGRGIRGSIVVLAYGFAWRLARAQWLRTRYRRVRGWLRSLRQRSAPKHVAHDAPDSVSSHQSQRDDHVREKPTEPR